MVSAATFGTEGGAMDQIFGLTVAGIASSGGGASMAFVVLLKPRSGLRV